MRILLINPNMTESMTVTLNNVARQTAKDMAEIIPVTASKGFPYKFIPVLEPRLSLACFHIKSSFNVLTQSGNLVMLLPLIDTSFNNGKFLRQEGNSLILLWLRPKTCKFTKFLAVSGTLEI